jgi:lysophospholipase L1-like esterase
MANRKEVTPATIGVLAGFAELPLEPGREAVINATLEAWIKDANELSRKMSAEKYRNLAPATVFTHPGETEEGG